MAAPPLRAKPCASRTVWDQGAGTPLARLGRDHPGALGVPNPVPGCCLRGGSETAGHLCPP